MDSDPPLCASSDESSKLLADNIQVAQLQKAKAKKAGEKKKDDAPPSPKKDVSEPTPKDEEPAPAPQENDEKELSDILNATRDSHPENEDAVETPAPAENEPSDSLPNRPSGHGRQPSLSLQSKMRSTSFRRQSSISYVPDASHSPSAVLKSPTLPPLTPDGDTMPDIYRKQALRLEELEKENRRLEKEAQAGESRWRKAEEELEELREAGSEVSALRAHARKGDDEVLRLKMELAALQRQTQLHSKSHRSTSSTVGNGDKDSPPSALLAQLESKNSTIEAMELEISNLRARLMSESSASTTHTEQIVALEEKLSRTENALQKSQTELQDARKALSRASEKAVKEGVDKTSTDTKIRTLDRDLATATTALAEAQKKAEQLEKKLEALGKLHKESEARHQVKVAALERGEREAGVLRAKLASIENETLRLREERDRRKKREAVGDGNEEGLDELEDEERARLERRVRELEGEIFDLRRGFWKQRRQILDSAGDDSTVNERNGAEIGDFDEVDLTGGGSSPNRRKSFASTGQKHSSFSTVLSSGIAAFTNAAPARQGSLDELLEDDDLDAGFDENAFRLAQQEEEARKMVEHVREVKRKLKDWHGWRLDLVDSRRGASGAGVGMGEIFEV